MRQFRQEECDFIITGLIFLHIVIAFVLLFKEIYLSSFPQQLIFPEALFSVSFVLFAPIFPRFV